MIEHLEKHVDEEHKKTAEKIEKVLHDKEYYHPMPIPVPVIHKVEIPKAKHDDKISVSFKKAPIPSGNDLLENLKINFGNKPRYKPVVNDPESSLDDIPLIIPAPIIATLPSPIPTPPLPEPSQPQQPQIVVVYKNAPAAQQYKSDNSLLNNLVSDLGDEFGLN